MNEGQMPPGAVRTTADSGMEGRLVVSAGQKTKKRKILKKVINSK